MRRIYWNKQKRESSPWVKGKKKPGAKKANKDLLFGTAFASLHSNSARPISFL